MKLVVATVGLGVGEQHARAYLNTGSCELKWLYDTVSERSQHLARQLGAGSPAESFEQVLEDPSVDIVSIASYDDAHFQQTIAALEAGKHVFVEKPLCRSFTELERIRQAQRLSKRHLSSNLVLRAAPLYKWLKDEIDEGKFGEIYAVDGEYLYGRLDKIVDGWRQAVENYSVMLGGGVHLVDLMLCMTGERPTIVCSAGNHLCTAGTSFRYDDYVCATFRFPSTAVGRISANFGCVHPHQHVVRVFGTQRTFVYDDVGPRVYLSRDPGAMPLVPDLQPLPSSKGALIPAFVNRILAGEDDEKPAAREFDVISACLAADTAVAAGGEVQVSYV